MAENKVEKAKYCDVAHLMDTFGKYQLIQYIAICIPALFVTMISINYIFVAGDINYRCRIDECEGFQSNSSTQFYPPWWPDSSIDRCSKPVLKPDVLESPGFCSNESFTGQLDTCTEFIYESNDTVVAALNLGCQPWKINLIGSVHNTGMLTSMVVSGWLSDRFGRKPTFIFCTVMGAIGNIKTFVSSYYVYIAVEFLEAAFTGGSFGSSMVILLEIVSRKHRLLSGVIFAYAIFMGECMFACIAMFVPYWKSIIRIINGPFIIFIVYIFVIKESPRWLILNGKIDRAKESLKRIAKTNNININFDELNEIDEAKLKNKFDIDEYQIKETYIEIFKSKELVKRLLVAGVCRFTSSFVYYGMMINSVFLPGDKYMNFLLMTVMSLPGELIALYIMNKIGRKVPLMVGYAVCGAVCVISAIVPASYVWAKITLLLIGKMIISACLTGALVYMMELFPTSVRGSLMGLGSFASRTGGMLAPLTPILNTVSPVLPAVFFGCSALLASSLLCLTPETKDLPLFDTINQVEASVQRRAETPATTVINNVEGSMETVITNM